MHQILIENARFYAKHGFYPEEQLAGGQFELNLCIETNFIRGMDQDELDGTIDYATLYAICAEEMAIPSKLLEHVAQRIVKRIKEAHTNIEHYKIKISKLNPPLSGQIEKVSIVIEE